MVKRPRKTAAPALLKIDLGCGQSKPEGFVGVDYVKIPGVDVVHDLTKIPWPFKPTSADQLRASHFFEHLTGAERMRFMEEAYRILVPTGQLVLVCPYWSSMRAIQDPTHQWPPVCETSFLYFNKAWRETNHLTHYPITCDFDFSYGYGLSPEWVSRNDESRGFGVARYLNTVADLHVTLVKRAP